MENELRKALEEVGLEKDSIELFVNKASLSDAKYYYSQFGWVVKEEKVEGFTGNLYSLKLERDHFIPDKDRLQKLEVAFEMNVKDLNKAKKRRDRAPFVLSIFTFVPGVLLVLLGVLFWFYDSNIARGVDIALISVGSLLFVLFCGFLFPLVMAEEKRFQKVFVALSKERRKIIGEAHRETNEV